jgi:hypothetical protein
MLKLSLLLSLILFFSIYNSAADEHCGTDMVTQSASASIAGSLNYAGVQNNKCKNCPSSLYEGEGSKDLSKNSNEGNSDSVSER